MGLQRRSPGPPLTGLSVGLLLLLFSWMNLAHPTDLSGIQPFPYLLRAIWAAGEAGGEG